MLVSVLAIRIDNADILHHAVIVNDAAPRAAQHRCHAMHENVFGDGLFSDYATLKFGVVVVAATLAWAFLKTGWELGTFHYKRLCTFVGALRKFCRDYWSKTAAV